MNQFISSSILFYVLTFPSLQVLSTTYSFQARKVGKFDMNPVGFGTWQWGNQFLWNYDPKNDDELKKTFGMNMTRSHLNFRLLLLTQLNT